MQLEEIQKLWEKDSVIDDTAYDSESTKIPQLHSKYYKIYVEEQLRLKQIEYKMKILMRDKYEFFSEGPSIEKVKEGWEYPAKGTILRADIDRYMYADKDVIAMSTKIDYTKSKVDFLESIIDNLNRRSFIIKNAIEWNRFKNGG